MSQSSKEPSIKAVQPELSETTGESPFEILCAQAEQINPAILLAEELMRKDIAELLDFDDLARAEETLEISKYEINQVTAQFEALTNTPAMASNQIPVGF